VSDELEPITDETTAALIATAVAAERERIIQGIEDEADVTPCLEDANVVRRIALLVRADFSYDRVEELEAESNAKQS
jgi:hypothetical protein